MLQQWLFYTHSNAKCHQVSKYIKSNGNLQKIKEWNLIFKFPFSHLSSLPFVISRIYFWWSLIYLIARASAAILFSARVYENARKPISVIRSVPSELWCEELQRFFEQIKIESNALSGKNFFFIRRSLLFSMAQALITYELVLLQFDDSETTWEDIIDCNSLT